MGLKQDLTELAKQLADRAAGHKVTMEFVDLISELRGIAKGLPDEARPRIITNEAGADWPDVLRQRAEMESRQAKVREKQNEAMAAGMIECVGGPADDTHIAVGGEGRVGSKVRVCGALYEYRADGRLHFVGGSAEAGL